MWEPKQIKHPSILMSLEYEEFASIEVEKRIKGAIAQFVISINIFDIIEDSVVTFDLREVEKALSCIKKQIEELYDKIPLFDDDDLDEWIESFQENLSSY